MSGVSPFYNQLLSQVISVTDSEPDLIANTANVAAILFEELNNLKENKVNWVGFYFVRQGGLVLGPFQGKVACIRIPFSKGVCGAAATTQQLQVVPDVHLFKGHISCDSASNSEVVAPIVVKGETVAVLDIDSVALNGLTEEDGTGLKSIADHLANALNWDQLK